jgi:threonylcarbamoyladenosine tRNA methylthiotransferase MtaB
LRLETQMPHPSLNGRTFALDTLGCRVNQYESSHVAETLIHAGCDLVESREKADIYIVHSCAVTSRASFETRQLLRRARRKDRAAVIVVMGCDANLEAERIASEGLATHILGNGEKFDVVQHLLRPGTIHEPYLALSNPREIHSFRGICVDTMAMGRARAILKVQDGCNAFCSYCIVPHTRGCSRSLPSSSVRRQMDHFLNHGYQEVVFSGIHLGQWGHDLSTDENLASLLRGLKPGGLPHRIRLSSLEPLEWTGELIRELQSIPELCSHFHVPLQSGDDEILKSMHRPYGTELYRELIQELRLYFPDATLGADVLVGFPGETDSRFMNTLSLLQDLPIDYLHVFPFSPRPGTPAASMKGIVDGRVMKNRAQRLRELSSVRRLALAERFLDQTLEVLVEKQLPAGRWQGTSRNYLKVSFSSPAELRNGDIVSVRLHEASSQGLQGELRVGCPPESP